MNVDVGEQLALELGAEFRLGATEPPLPTRQTIELDLVVCTVCTGHHPTERCPQRVVCPVCTGAHHASSHLGTA